MADTITVAVPLESEQAIEIKDKFKKSDVPLTLDYRRVGLRFYWEARLGTDSFTIKPEAAAQDDFNPAAARSFKASGNTPDEAVCALDAAFKLAVTQGELVGFHSRRHPDIDTIRFVGETGNGAPKVVALANFYQGKQTHPFIML